MANKIMKSTLASVLAIMSVAASVPGTAIGNVIADTAITASATVVSGNFECEELPDGTLCITKFEGTGSVIDIPDKLDGKPITKIGDKAFMGNEYVTEITSDNFYLNSIGEFAFCNCTALKKIYLPNSIETLGRGAFANCSSLTDIRIPSLEAIEEGTFQRCTSLEVFHIPGRVKYIGTGAFQECTNLKEVYFHCTTIGKKAFYKCENLSTIDMRDVVDIEDYAFFGCTSLSEIYPYEVKTIGNSAFGSCTALTDLHLMTHGHELTSIGNDAFANCKNLEFVVLPENLTTLGKRAFTNCHALKGVVIWSKNLTTIPMGAFATTGITFIDIPEGVTTIDGAAFNSCKSLEEIKLPSTLKTIGAKAFDNTGVKNVSYNSHEAQWNDIEIGEGNDVLESAEKIFSVAPANIPVSYERNGNDITFTWSPVDGIEKYGIVGYYYDNFYHTSSGYWALRAETTGTSYTMKNLKPDTDYHFAIVPMVNGKWNENISDNNVIKFTTEPKVFTYPSLRTIEYNEPTHQFRLWWTDVKDAENYGIAVKLAGKWKVQKYTDANTTTFTSPKLKAGSKYEMVICAKVNGKWDTSNLSKRAFTVTVK
ncbi:MAG: leucine-rich repeat protein [Ruminococcus sp.]|uniref:leucine-rich repeat protein n=1 Tax=Ruminococcus sp. TaxID=41978 RepID=UPI0025EE83A6|nr:leucine-rich repeat protein [Ruminococcus sp.]MBO4865486.1 leucine-rich repeat protein [Ruminococcus sp.]